MAKQIHNKSKFRSDLRYARNLIAEIEKAIKIENWESVVDDSRELEAVFSLLGMYGTDNREGILDFGCKYPDEIREIRAQQLAESEAKRQKELVAWHKAAEKEAREFEKALGIKITVVTEGLETK